jgi:hypothetical protein
VPFKAAIWLATQPLPPTHQIKIKQISGMLEVQYLCDSDINIGPPLDFTVAG